MSLTSAGLRRRIQLAIDRMVSDGRKIGVQVAVVRRGQLVVDAVAGTCDADAATGRARHAGAALGVMRNRFSPDLAAVTELDRIVADAFPPSP